MVSTPKDKILVLFENGNSNISRRELIQGIFEDATSDSLDDEATIVKELTWTTKYYKASFDLYIDSYDSLAEWTAEFTDTECKPLRDIIAGIIIVGDVSQKQKYKGQVDKIATNIHCDSFLIWINCNEKYTEEEYDVVETVNWKEDCESNESNEFNEKLGCERVKEILDTYPWDTTQLIDPSQFQRSSTSTEHTSNRLELESILGMLNQARQQYQTLDSDENPEEYASNMAEEIAKYI